jgi:hypothetical protein
VNASQTATFIATGATDPIGRLVVTGSGNMSGFSVTNEFLFTLAGEMTGKQVFRGDCGQFTYNIIGFKS